MPPLPPPNEATEYAYINQRLHHTEMMHIIKKLIKYLNMILFILGNHNNNHNHILGLILPNDSIHLSLSIYLFIYLFLYILIHKQNTNIAPYNVLFSRGLFYCNLNLQ